MHRSPDEFDRSIYTFPVSLNCSALTFVFLTIGQIVVLEHLFFHLICKEFFR